MNIDWVTIAATFGAAIAGSWSGARATNQQTSINVRLERDRWMKERYFEFLETSDEFVNVSFRKEALGLHDRDRLTRKLLTLASIVMPENQNQISQMVYEVRNLHVGKKCELQFSDVEKYFDELQVVVKTHISELVN